MVLNWEGESWFSQFMVKYVFAWLFISESIRHVHTEIFCFRNFGFVQKIHLLSYSRNSFLFISFLLKNAFVQNSE